MNFTNKIIRWYHQNKRELPWRKTTDPYAIWVSEIIFQQTRINQGLEYYKRFMKRFPTVFELAGADEQEVLRYWQGLGYYSRARNLHHTANIIVSEYNGVFPGSYEEVVALKGIGEYTAAAILSIAFGKARPLVDGNVSRVLTRIFGITTPIDSTVGQKDVWKMAGKLIDENDPGTYNQAVMEFGALYCIPQKPDCKNCIFSTDCFAFKNNMVNSIPVKARKKTPVNRYFHYFMFDYSENGNHLTYLNKRKEKDIWQHLYDFPLIETESPVSGTQLESLFAGKFMSKVRLSKMEYAEYKHILTHRIIWSRFFRIPVGLSTTHEKLIRWLQKSYTEVAVSELNHYPVSRLVEKFLNDLAKN